MSRESSPTVVVELTPPGRAAVAVVLVAGADAAAVVGDCFIPVSGRALAELPLGRIAFGRWGGPPDEEVVVCRRSEEQIEIHCHGGSAAVGAITERLRECGCGRVSWQDWLRSKVGPPSRGGPEPSVPLGSRHLPSHDATTRAAQIALARAPTARTAGVLLDQYHGALSGAIEAAIEAIGGVDWAQAAEVLDGLLRFRGVGLHLTEPWRVVLAGAPNVGKSSLINALAGYERAIVSPQPGTTRDVVTATSAFDGWPVRLADTAGMRESADALESAGARLTAEALADSDVAAVVNDVTQFGGIVAEAPLGVRTIHVNNKVDLLDSSQRADLEPNSAIATSAVTGEGLNALVNAIARTLVPIAPAAGAAVPFTNDQVAGLEAARQAVERREARAAEAALNGLLADR